MKCPYCKSEITDGELFCPVCGQSISAKSLGVQSTQAYWAEYEKKVDKDISHARSVKAQTKSKNRKARNATVVCVALCCAIIAAIVCMVLANISSNEKKLEAIHIIMIGETYDDVRENAYWVGESCDRRVATITDFDTLEFEEGNYKSYTDSSGNTAWSTNEIYRTATYSYELSITFTGKIYMHVGGGKFEVELTEDGAVWAIRFYG